MSEYLLISDAAKEVQVESHVLRYWEEELHLPIKRNELGHRYYTKEDVECFKQIKSMKERGLQLKAIKMILKDGRLDIIGERQPEPTKIEGLMTGGDTKEVRLPEAFQKETDTRDEGVKETGRKEVNLGNIDNKEAVGKRMPDEIMPIQIVDRQEMVTETRTTRQEAKTVDKEDKVRRLQWLLQQMIHETIRENNEELCREIRESFVKELDYQFRAQEEREDERCRIQQERNEQYYKQMDELIRKKNRRILKEDSANASVADQSRQQEQKGQKKKRHFIF